MGTVYLMRHCQAKNPSDKAFFNGCRSDYPLTEKGLADAASRAEIIAEMGLNLEAIYCSGLIRARQTAEPLAALLGLEVGIEPCFREIDFGYWDNKTNVEAMALPKEIRWVPGISRYHVRVPGGECFREVAERAERGVELLHRRHQGNVLVVSHGGLIRSYLVNREFRPFEMFEDRSWIGFAHLFNADTGDVVLDGIPAW